MGNWLQIEVRLEIRQLKC